MKWNDWLFVKMKIFLGGWRFKIMKETKIKKDWQQ